LNEPIAGSGFERSQEPLAFAAQAKLSEYPGAPPPSDFQSIALNYFSDIDVWSAYAEHQLQRSYTGQWLKTPLDFKYKR
jgi:hypothetical protein